jgi:hypothetical protein
MSALSHVQALCEIIRPRVTIPVILGRPDSAIPGLYVWPWRMEVNVEWANRPARPPSGEVKSLVDQPAINIHILILPIPALSVEGWTCLETAQLAIHDHPVLPVDGVIMRVIPEANLSVEALSAIFIAAQLPLSVCAACVFSGPMPVVQGAGT